MSSIAGLTLTGRKLLGPASDLVEVEDKDGLRHTAIVFHSAWQQHPAITDALSVVIGFLESPLVTGLVELVGHEPSTGAFIYPTGRVWSVAELIRLLADRGERGGVRAGLELMYTAGQILVEGADAGQSQGVYSHGGLTPRRIMVKSDGQVMVVGYGLPQVEILRFHEDRRQVPREDSFRYCPPERMEARPEDLTSDLFGLALIGFEMMTGKPVYDGLVNDIRQQAARGEGSRRLFRFREVLPESVRNLLTKALRPDAEARYISGDDFLADVHALLSDRNVPGPSLLDVMEMVQDEGQRVGQAMQQGRTQMVDQDELKAQLEEPSDRTVESLGRSSADVWVSGRRRTIARRTDLAPTDVPEGPVDLRDDPPPPAADPTPATEQSDVADGRWSKVRRSPRNAPRNVSVEPEEIPVTISPMNQHIEKPEPAVDKAPPKVGPPSRGIRRSPRSESALVDGGDAQAPLVPPPPAVPTPPTVPSITPLIERAETEEAGGPADGIPLPPVIPTASPEPLTAEDLLARIRSGVSGSTSKREVNSVSNQATMAFQREPVVELTVDNGSDEAATVMLTPDQLRQKFAVEVSSSEAVVSVENSGTQGLEDDDVSLEVTTMNGRSHSVTLPGNLTAAQAVSWMVGRFVALPMDQSGTLQGWFRLERSGERLDVVSTLSSVGPGSCDLAYIEADTRVVEVQVNANGSDVQFSNPMNTAVPIASLVAHLQDWLALPEADWRLVYDGKIVPDDWILDDLNTDGALTVQLRPAQS